VRRDGESKRRRRGLAAAAAFVLAFHVCSTASAAVLDDAAADPATVKWRGDFETGDASQWDAFLSERGGQLAIVSFPVVQGRYAARFTLGGARASRGGRAEMHDHRLAQGGARPGAELVYDWWLLIPRASRLPKGLGMSTTQWHNADACYGGGLDIDGRGPWSRWSALFRGGRVVDWDRGCRYRHERTFDLGPLVRGRWTHFRLHVKWHRSPAVGFVRIWVDGVPKIPFTRLATLSAHAYARQSVRLRQGIYRGPLRGTTVLYGDGMTIYEP
jgi:polysaccharide lyase-like protein